MKKTCPKCDSDKELSEFYKSPKTKDGLKSWCKECCLKDNKKRESNYNQTRKDYRINNQEKYREQKRNYYLNNKSKILSANSQWRQTINGKLLSYKRGAINRNIEWNISEEQFLLFWQNNCHYCGNEIETIGLDRIDYKKGYLIDNIVPCCSICNMMKGKNNSIDFLNQITKIWEHTKK